MDLVANVTDDIRVWGTSCTTKGANITVTYSVFFLNLLCIHLATKFLHEFLRRYGQPRIVSEFIIALMVGNVRWIGSTLENHVGRVLNVVGQFSMICYLFVLGLEMKPRTIFRRPSWDAAIAYSGVITTFGTCFSFYRLLLDRKNGFSNHLDYHFLIALALILSNTASPILTRLTTDLKIGKSHIGRIVVNAAILNDMVNTLVTSVGIAIMKSPHVKLDRELSDGYTQELLGLSWVFFVIFAQTMFVIIIVPHFAAWINERNPEGKPMKGFDLALSLAVVMALTQFATVVKFDLAFNAFLIGLAFPKEGRLTTMLISKINFMITTFGLPYFLCAIGMQAHLGAWDSGTDMYGTKWTFLRSLTKLLLLVTIGTVGKVLGSFIVAMIYGFKFTEAIAIGLLLNVKGYFHILVVYLAFKSGFINANTFIIFLFVIISTVIYIPLVVRLVLKRARRSLQRPLMTLQGLDPSAEVQIVMGIIGPQHVSSTLSIVEATRGQSATPLTVYAMDLVEKADSSVISSQDVYVEGNTVEEGISRMREETGLAFENYVQEGGEGLTVVRLQAIANIGNMHEDLCRAAQETASVLIVMPFHRTQMTVESGERRDMNHPGLRHINRKVLYYAPCSVGILVDRGLSEVEAPSKVAIIFIGGSDDREALVLAGRMASYQAFQLTVVRFLQESGAETKLARTRGLVIEKTVQEKEMHLDDECFAKFFETHIAGGRVGYLEKYIGSGSEAVVVLKALDGQYRLFIVGRDGCRNPVLTAGMGDWAECPELGPVGDVLSSSDFSDKASVLIIQQHDLERDQDFGDDDLK